MRRKPTTYELTPKAEKALQILNADAAAKRAAREALTVETSEMDGSAVPFSPEPPVSQERENAVSSETPSTMPVAHTSEPVRKFTGFIAWLQTPEGRDSADPRWLPQEPSRREMELERRLRCAWDASRM